MISLFPDQIKSIDSLRDSMRRNKRIILQGETGSGKSIMASYMISSALSKKKKCAFIVPRKELLRQMSETFNNFGIPHSYIAAGKQFNPYSSAHLCTVGTLCNRLDLITPDVVFIDECHYANTKIDSIINHYSQAGSWIIGLSATPENDNLYLWYQDMVFGPTMAELISMKRLSDYRYFAPHVPDLSKIKTYHGEYSQGQLDDYMYEDKVIVGSAVGHYKEHAFGKLNMTFCTSIKTSQMTAQKFNDAGIPSIHMDGDTPEDERRRIARAFARREILNLCTVDLVLFGYDLSSASGIKGANVESMSDLRPTKRRNVQRQKIGRVLRYKDYPAIISDHVGNFKDHGRPSDPIEYTLSPPKQKKSDGEKAPPTRQCPNCFYVHSPAPICPECGTAYEVKSREIDEVDGDLVEIDKEAEVRKRRTEQGRARSLEDLIALGQKRGMKYPAQWAAKVLAGRMMKNANST